MRGNVVSTVRDNVIFELGLFIGRRGMERCFFLQPHGTETMRLPSDLLGWQPLYFMANRRDDNTLAALGSCSLALRGAFSRLGRTVTDRNDLIPTSSDTRTSRGSQKDSAQRFERYVNLWNSEVLSADRARLHSGIVMWVSEDDEGLDTNSLSRVRAFLETVCDAALRGELDNAAVHEVFGTTIHVVNDHARHFFRHGDSDSEWESPMQDWLNRLQDA